jgi:hypothetical protein
VTDARTTSTSSGLFGLALAACIALPFDPDTGKSILGVIIEAFGRDWLNGLLIALMLAPPYAIGLCVGLATFSGGRIGTTLVKLPLVLLHLEAVLLALMLFHEDEGRGTLGLLGFTIVMAVRLFTRAARSRNRGTHASVGWLARTGGVLVAGLFGWFRLQTHGEDIGIAIVATIIAAAMMAVTARTRDSV